MSHAPSESLVSSYIPNEKKQGKDIWRHCCSRCGSFPFDYPWCSSCKSKICTKCVSKCLKEHRDMVFSCPSEQDVLFLKSEFDCPFESCKFRSCPLVLQMHLSDPSAATNHISRDGCHRRIEERQKTNDATEIDYGTSRLIENEMHSRFMTLTSQLERSLEECERECEVNRRTIQEDCNGLAYACLSDQIGLNDIESSVGNTLSEKAVDFLTNLISSISFITSAAHSSVLKTLSQYKEEIRELFDVAGNHVGALSELPAKSGRMTEERRLMKAAMDNSILSLERQLKGIRHSESMCGANILSRNLDQQFHRLRDELTRLQNLMQYNESCMSKSLSVVSALSAIASKETDSEEVLANLHDFEIKLAEIREMEVSLRCFDDLVHETEHDDDMMEKCEVVASQMSSFIPYFSGELQKVSFVLSSMQEKHIASHSVPSYELSMPSALGHDASSFPNMELSEFVQERWNEVLCRFIESTTSIITTTPPKHDSDEVTPIVRFDDCCCPANSDKQNVLISSTQAEPGNQASSSSIMPHLIIPLHNLGEAFPNAMQNHVDELLYHAESHGCDEE